MPYQNKPVAAGKEARFNNARSARSLVREVYGRYVLGKDQYPRMRITTPLEELMPRVRPAAALLMNAWRDIDTDNDYFFNHVQYGCNALAQSDKTEAAGLIIAKSGRNAVRFGNVSLLNGEVSVSFGLFTPAEAMAIINRANYTAADGNQIRYNTNGDLYVPPTPDAVIIRDRPHGSASLFFDTVSLPEAA